MSASMLNAAQTVTPTRRAIADDEDEIVYPVSSQSSEASTSPALGEEVQRDYSTELTIAKNLEGSYKGQLVKNSDLDPFVNDFILERGDAGSKVWSPPSTEQRARPRGRGHRSTKSEPAIQSAPVIRDLQPTLEPVKESWADDVKGLESRMARASLNGPTDRPRSTPGRGEVGASQSPTSTPRKQRGQKKPKANRSRRASAPGPGPNNAKAAKQAFSSLDPSPSPTKLNTSGTVAAPNAGSPTKKKAKKGKSKPKAKKESVPEPTPEPAPSTAPSTPRGFGRRSIVDDVSENGDAVLTEQTLAIRQSDTDRLLGIAYDEAVKFMNAFIENPDYYTSRASRLTFLQALIVELGLVSTTGPERALPESLTAAKALLKTHAFLNVKDYLTLREKGLDALRSAMRPSRSALVRDLRGRNGRRAKLGWVKETGLNVLLVSCQY